MNNILRRTSHGMFSTFYLNPKSYNGQHLDYDKSFSTLYPKDVKELKELVSSTQFVESEEEIRIINSL